MMRGLVLAMAAALLLAGCGKDEKTQPGAAKLIHITFVTDWKAQAEHGGFYQALAEGLYARRGLDVKIVPGGPDVGSMCSIMGLPCACARPVTPSVRKHTTTAASADAPRRTLIIPVA